MAANLVEQNGVQLLIKASTKQSHKVNNNANNANSITIATISNTYLE